MKFSLVVLVVCLIVIFGLATSEKALRLPLPDAIRKAYPWLEHELIYPDNDYVRIVGGTSVSAGEHPHQIALLVDNSFICGGSLIGSSTVLTAAHCVFGNENRPSRFTIRYGTVDRTNGPTVGVSKVNRHPNYSSSTIDYDVATFSLSSPFTPSSNAAVVTLADTEPAVGSSTILTGWGRTSAGGSVPVNLQKADQLKTLSQSDCQNRWGLVNTITSRMLCAFTSTQSACNGDSGGPLVSNGKQVGVVSWGSSSCLHSTYPNVYVNVANVLSWINANP